MNENDIVLLKIDALATIGNLNRREIGSKLKLLQLVYNLYINALSKF